MSILQVAVSPDKPLVWLQGEIKAPPFSKEARLEAGFLIAEVFSKKTRKTPPEVIETSQKRLKAYDDVARARSRR
jgi:hypothetical protein